MRTMILIGMVFLGGCGVNAGNPGTGGGKTSTDTELSLELIASSYAETVSAIADNISDVTADQISSTTGGGDGTANGAGAMHLVGAINEMGEPIINGPVGPEQSIRFSDFGPGPDNGTKRPPPPQFPVGAPVFSCVTAETTVTETMENKFSAKFEMGHHGQTQTVDIVSMDSMTSVWSDFGGAITCPSLSDRASIDRAHLNEFKQAVSFSTQRSDSATGPGDGPHGKSFSSSGQRDVAWKKVASENADEYVVNQSVTSTITYSRAGELASKDGDAVPANRRPFSFTAKMIIPPEAPLTAATVFNTRGAVTRHTITSGTVRSVQDSNSLIENKFSNVVIEFAKGCTPISGTISGKIYDDASSILPAVTYAIEFSDENPVITFSDGRKQSMNFDTCFVETNRRPRR